VKNLCNENYKTLMKEIEVGTNGRIFQDVHGVEESVLLKWPF
jgi:hypothetical protein